MLFTDEATFTREGVFNTRNNHIWSDENPHSVRERSFQRQFSVNVWAGLINGHLIGPHFLPQRLNGEMYLNFLNNDLFNLLEDVPLATRANMWYLHDGAPCHNTGIVRTWLQNNFPNRWIGRNGPVSWPARSPDLTPCDFFLWGYMKQLVYAVPIDNIDILRERIQTAALFIRNRRDVLEQISVSQLRRAHCCIANDGGHFENLL